VLQVEEGLGGKRRKRKREREARVASVRKTEYEKDREYLTCEFIFGVMGDIKERHVMYRAVGTQGVGENTTASEGGGGVTEKEEDEGETDGGQTHWGGSETCHNGSHRQQEELHTS
jgi:hypothetical protein